MFVAIITTAILLFYLVYALTAEDMALGYPGARALVAVYVLTLAGLGWVTLLGGEEREPVAVDGSGLLFSGLASGRFRSQT